MHRCFDSDHVNEKFCDLPGLPFELFFVGEVLVLAATAYAKMLAVGFNAIRRRCENFYEIGMRAICLVAPDFGADLFSGQCEGNEYNPIVRFGNSGTEIG